MTMIDHQAIVTALQRKYAAPSVDPEWVRQCVQALIEDGQRATLDAVHEQYLWADLASSSLPPSILPTDPAAAHNVKLFPSPALLQIESIMEIGASAFQLQNVVNQRKDVLEGRTRIRRIDDPDGDDEVDEDNMPVYPRSMLRLELSDGRNKIKAMEYRRLDGLKLGETPLGCKLLLKHVPVLRGILMLEPSNTEIIGGMVEDLEATQAETFIASLVARIDAAKNGGDARTTPARQRRIAQPGAGRAGVGQPAAAVGGNVTRRGRSTAATPAARSHSAAGPSSSSRPQRAAGQNASARIGRLYEQTAQQPHAGPSRASARTTTTLEDSDIEEMDSFEADPSFFRAIDEVEMRARGPRQAQIEMVDDDDEDDEDDFGDDIQIDDSIMLRVDAAEMQARSHSGQGSARAKRKHVVASDSESEVMDSGKENKPIVIDSD